MDGDTTARLIYLTLLLAAVSGPLILSLRTSPGKTVQQLLIWVFIFLGCIAAYGLWPDLKPALYPSAAVMRNGKLEIQVANDGHFYAELQVNGTPITFLIDTGASDIVLSREDAALAGIDLASLSFWDQAETANGTVASAPVTLESLALGPWRDQGIAASVNGGDMRDSLLGMAYLHRFQLITSDGRLTLSR